MPIQGPTAPRPRNAPPATAGTIATSRATTSRVATGAPAGGGSAGAAARARGLVGLRIVSFESRRAQDLGLLIRRNGGEVSYAPAMREIPLADEHGILEFGA